jgi:diguanylate cyclase (GGDEF)-like protein/PAS domain S-box-containing protein
MSAMGESRQDVRPGSAPARADHGEPLATLYSSIVEESADFIVVVDGTGTIHYMNASGGAITGWDPARAVGRSIFDLVHPEDVDRAIFDLTVHSEPGVPPGYSTYRISCFDGSWVAIQLTSAEVTDGTHRFLTTYSRRADVSTAEVLYALLRGTSADEALQPVLEMFNWRIFGSRVGVCWSDDEGYHQVATSLPPELTGCDGVESTPWALCRRTAEGALYPDLSTLDDERRALAEGQNLGAFWVEPVVTDESSSLVGAVITVWTRQDGPSPQYHTSGMRAAKNFVELILRWTRQVAQLDAAAHGDALTGLSNRKAFFELLGSGDGGAILYCDLDRFKVVNDELGHRAGDELLCAVAARIRGAVRTGDVVARLGGDEFAVLCEGATREQAGELAERIRAALIEPFHIMGTMVSVGMSVGVARVSGHLGENVLESADRALYRAKAEGGNAVRWPEEGE